jgi:hypothetical protein
MPDEPIPPAENDFVPATDAVFTRAWSTTTGKTIRALGGETIAGIDVLDLAERIVATKVDLADRAAIEVLASAADYLTSPQYRSKLIDAAIAVAADRLFLSSYGPQASWRREPKPQD